ncbi:MAG: LVIVD repeat-containing protein [Actinomycetota bacterium]
MKLRTISLTLTAVLLAGVAAAPAVLAAVEKSDNVKLVAHFPYKNENLDFFSGGTDIDFSGRYVYAMQQGADGGIHIIDNSGAKPKKVGFFACPGEQNDVAVVKPGLVALGYHSSQCGGPGAGVRLVDVSNAKRPKLLGAVNNLPGGTHTLTTYPGKPIIYASPGGLANGNGVEQILDVSDPAKPKVAATFQPNRAGCHDLTFHFHGKEKLAFCAGLGEVQIWDVSDPLAPVTIGRTVPPTQFAHSVAITHDGKYMVIGDEAVAGNDCIGGPTGSLWIYDITNRALPLLQGHVGPPRGQQPAGSSNVDRNTWCSAHLFNFVPGTYTLVTSWYSGGMNVVDLSNPMQPEEIAFYMATGEKKDITNYWSAYWYDGRIYANDRVRGLDVFEVQGLKEGKHHH